MRVAFQPITPASASGSISRHAPQSQQSQTTRTRKSPKQSSSRWAPAPGSCGRRGWRWLRPSAIFFAAVSTNDRDRATQEREGAHRLTRIDLGGRYRPLVVLALVVVVLALVVLTDSNRCSH